MAVHEFHVWQLAGNRIIASAHIRCKNVSDYMVVAEQVKTFFHNEGIHSTTIQPEFAEVSATVQFCYCRGCEFLDIYNCCGYNFFGKAIIFENNCYHARKKLSSKIWLVAKCN